MHETSLVYNVVDIVLNQAENCEVERVTGVHLTIGRLRDISESIFEGMFERLTRDTIAEGAELVISRPPIMLRCKSCGYVFHFDAHDEATHRCPACQDKNYAIHSGLEFLVGGIEASPRNEPQSIQHGRCT